MTAHIRNAEYKNGQNILARNLEGTSKELYSFKLLFFVDIELRKCTSKYIFGKNCIACRFSKFNFEKTASKN